MVMVASASACERRSARGQGLGTTLAQAGAMRTKLKISTMTSVGDLERVLYESCLQICMLDSACTKQYAGGEREPLFKLKESWPYEAIHVFNKKKFFLQAGREEKSSNCPHQRF